MSRARLPLTRSITLECHGSDAPETLELQTAVEEKKWVSLGQMPGGTIKQSTRIALPNVMAKYFRIKYTGFDKANTGRYHTLQSISFSKAKDVL